MTVVIGIVGISGVGKSTFVRGLQKSLSFQHLSAGQIIKSQMEHERLRSQDHDTLRTLDIDDNQRLLVDGFHDALDTSQSLAIFDGHTVIDTSSQLRTIQADIFKALRLRAFIFLHERPEVISDRRTADSTRSRPAISLGEIARHQAVALTVTAEVSLEMGIPCLAIGTGQREAAVRFIKAQWPQ